MSDQTQPSEPQRVDDGPFVPPAPAMPGEGEAAPDLTPSPADPSRDG